MRPPSKCVCGCGREVPMHLEGANQLAIGLIPELLAWDRFRVELARDPSCAPGSPITPERLDAFLAEGGGHYRDAVAVVHDGKAFTSLGRAPGRWLKEAAKSRRKLAKIAGGAIDPARTPALSEEDLQLLDRQHPESTFSGSR